MRSRRTRCWSQKELAFRSRLNRTCISGIERGNRNRTITVLKGLADAPAVPPEALLETDVPLARRQRTDPDARSPTGPARLRAIALATLLKLSWKEMAADCGRGCPAAPPPPGKILQAIFK